MAPEAPISEGTCPICLEYFKDPVNLESCGHHFCKTCLTQYWRESSTESTCPQCSGAFPQSNFKTNWQLANLNLVKLEEGVKTEGIIVCKEEEIPIALDYDRPRDLQDHDNLPMDENSQDLKVAENSGTGPNNRRGRGVSWRHKETLDLLDIWGEQKIQDQLRASHRNIDFFEYIAQEMAVRGHCRTAVECRSKTKVMRLEYKRVISHNSRPGSNKVTCPFYKQLHRILRGDASVASKRVARRLSPEEASQQGSLSDHPVLEDHFLSEDLGTINFGEYFKEGSTDKLLESTGNTRDGMMSGNDTEEEMVEAGDNNIIQTEEEGSNGVSGKEMESQRPQVSPQPQQPLNNVDPPPTTRPKAALPVATRLSLMRTRKKRERSESMFHLFLEQAREDSIKEQEEMVRDRVMLAGFLRAFEQDAADSREERKQCLESLRTNCEVLQGILSGLNKLTDVIASQQSASAGGQVVSRHPLLSATHKENLPHHSASVVRSSLPSEALPSHPTSSTSTAPKSGPRRPTTVTHVPTQVTCNLG
ncbi:myb/SANT-like DNA-binding domain-containing protein 7 [Anolis sagrei]|uniref:myb/SANT-like DNA-binding domain-containing protein 7 n=1 Tax=Anolis sagrei TaxID=38937 RepID=UPI003522E434